MKIKTLDQLLDHCKASGWNMACYYEDPADPDYAGDDVVKAKEALEACEEMRLKIYDPIMREIVGVVLVVSGLDPEEQIADYGGDRLTKLMEETCSA